jgi:hypothetical protein
MASRLRAFTIATAGILAGLAAGLVTLAATGGNDFRSTMTTGLPYGTILLPGALIVAALWVKVGARNARSSASLGAQAALFGLAAALVTVILLALIEQALGKSAF